MDFHKSRAASQCDHTVKFADQGNPYSVFDRQPQGDCSRHAGYGHPFQHVSPRGQQDADAKSFCGNLTDPSKDLPQGIPVKKSGPKQQQTDQRPAPQLPFCCFLIHSFSIHHFFQETLLRIISSSIPFFNWQSR